MIVIPTVPAIKAVASILKKRFPNLTVEETIDIAGQIVQVLQGLSTHDA